MHHNVCMLPCIPTHSYDNLLAKNNNVFLIHESMPVRA